MTDAPDWITLTEDEQLVWSGRPSVVPYLLAAAGSIVLVGIGIAVWLVGSGGIDVGVAFPSVVPWAAVGGVVALLGVLGLLRELLDWWSRRYAVTTEEVYKKRGVLSRSVTNLRHDQVQNTTFTQSVLGRLFSFGNVRVDTAGGEGTEIVLTNADDPDVVVEEITRQLDG